MSAAETAQPPIVEDDLVLRPDDDDDGAEGDSAYGGSDPASDTTSVSSSIYQGVIKHGRRYQAFNDGGYFTPADERQFDAIDMLHQVTVALEAARENPYYYSPLAPNAKNIIDLGTGTGVWPVDVADAFSNLTVYGVDLYPPPQSWLPPNCILEVDDISKPWIWSQKFDLVHIRYLLGSFNDRDWERVYAEAFKNLNPGGWIEQLEVDTHFLCDDDSIANVASDSPLHSWGKYMIEAGKKSGKKLDTAVTMRDKIEAAGFTNIHQKHRKIPCGPWAKSAILKDIGKVELESVKAGCEGYAMYLLTQVGTPEVWSPEEVQVYLAAFRRDLSNPKVHGYHRYTRVWAQKPMEAGSGSQATAAAAS